MEETELLVRKAEQLRREMSVPSVVQVASVEQEELLMELQRSSPASSSSVVRVDHRPTVVDVMD